jgi:hypothetical protein
MSRALLRKTASPDLARARNRVLRCLARARNRALRLRVLFGLVLFAGCTPLDSSDGDDRVVDPAERDSGDDDDGRPSSSGDDDGKPSSSGGNDAGSAGAGSGARDSGGSELDSSVPDSSSADGGSPATPPPCTEGAACLLSDNSTGVCTAGVCGPCAGGACAPVACTGPSACTHLNAPCRVVACEAGACVARFAPVGASCDDGAWCTTADTCDGAGACKGSARVCNDGLSCTTDRCVEASRTCEAPVTAGCKIEGACVAANANNPANACAMCDPARSSSAYTAITTSNAGDGCCPPGANALTDADCVPVCGNGIKEGFEGCDDGGAAGGCTEQCTLAPLQRAIVASYYGVCALTSRGTVTCWGDIKNPYPSDTFTELCAAKFYVCGLRPNGKAECWGGSAAGAPPAGQLFTQLGCGGTSACGLRADGTAVCWGTDAADAILTPQTTKFTDLAGGTSVMCGLISGTQNAKCWGWDGGGAVSGVPAKAFAQIAMGYWSHCGIDTAGTATCWGTSVLPGVNGATGIKRMSGGQGAMCAVLGTGRLQCWADDRRTQVLSEMPTVGGFDGVAVSLTGGTHECAITTADRVYCWGEEESSGQLNVPAGLRP